MSVKRYVPGPHVITEDGMFHFNAPLGNHIKVDGRLFEVTWSNETNCFESYIVGRHNSYLCAGKTRAYLSAHIHTALFPWKPAHEWIAADARTLVIIARARDWFVLKNKIRHHLIVNNRNDVDLIISDRPFTAVLTGSHRELKSGN